MLILAFGSHSDPHAWEMSDKLKDDGFNTKKSDNPQDILNLRGEVVILDVVKGLDKPAFITIKQLKSRKLFTAHDFDVGFFLKMLDESGMIDNLRIIGIPEEWDEEAVKEVKKLL